MSSSHDFGRAKQVTFAPAFFLPNTPIYPIAVLRGLPPLHPAPALAPGPFPYPLEEEVYVRVQVQVQEED